MCMIQELCLISFQYQIVFVLASSFQIIKMTPSFPESFLVEEMMP
jgi:hypothetical protein